MSSSGNDLGKILAALGGRLRNASISLRNAVSDALPGDRPSWLVVEMRGSYPARKSRKKLVSRLLNSERQATLEEFEALISGLLRSEWLTGVVFQLDGLSVDLSTAYALRRQLQRLRQGGKRVEVEANRFDNSGFYLASAADRVIAPEGAEFFVNGMSFSTTFMADALARFGVRFEKLAVEEFKNAGDQFVLPAMSDAQREQYEALIESLTRTVASSIAEDRGFTAEEVQGWIDEGVTSAAQAKELGMIDLVAYQDEYQTSEFKPLAQGLRFVPGLPKPVDSQRVAVVSMSGTIVPGRSRKTPLPLPLFGEEFAGSQTVVNQLRAAGSDKRTAAVVLHVDSGGGSALASDLIWREVKVLADKMPVVAVMGQLAASGGYYVLTHATEVIAAPTTLTGSIGVVMLKPVLEEFNERYGFNPESVKGGRFAEIMSSAKGFDEQERALMQRYNAEVYQRFIARVAQGRELSTERVNELGRGRVWSGVDALGHGLVDDLGDVAMAVARARSLAGLPTDAPTWNVETPKHALTPPLQEPKEAVRLLNQLLSERALLVHPQRLDIR